ncbi:CehA/McbA family metallohydrolase [bacterium]|nr:CehA/McbA family metallohydrolase [bacterium]
MKNILLPIIIITSLLFQGCSLAPKWYRGNTHAHTVICGHADSSPEVVASWYHDHGYNFLILSEHNHFIDPDSVGMPPEKRQDYILIPGEEISGPQIVHTTAMNIGGLVTSNKKLEKKSEILQNHVDVTLAAGGNTILNHPNYVYTVSADDILPVKRLYLFELFNGHPYVNNAGDDEHPSTETLWDDLLTKGMIIYGVSSDDAHHFSEIDTQYSNPGRGWVMVKTTKLSPGKISKAMQQGLFYASNGVMLKRYSRSKRRYLIEVDLDKTLKELDSPDIHGKRISTGEPGFFIEFIGPGGEILSVSKSPKASYAVNHSAAYVRGKITFRRKHQDGGMEEFYAWGQPVFTDGRTKYEETLADRGDEP